MPSETEEKIIALTNGLRKDYQKKINNTYIWFSVSYDAIREAKENDSFTNNKKVIVPSIKKPRKLVRTKDDIINILEQAYNRDLPQTIFLQICNIVEGYFYDLLEGVLLIDNRRIKIKTSKIKFGESIDVNTILDSVDQKSLIKKIIESNLISVFYSSPEKQIEYIGKLFSTAIDEKLSEYFEKQKEFKAARDLIVHNNGVINEFYLRKSGDLSRGIVGEELKLEKKHIDELVSYTKSLIGKLSSEINKNIKIRH